MSGDWWANQIGTAATVTTPTGSVPQYDLAYELGIAPWQNQASFNMFVEDVAPQVHKRDIDRVKAAKEQAEMGWFQKAVGAVGEDFSSIVGSASLFFQDPAGYFEGDYNEKRRQGYLKEGERQFRRYEQSKVGQALELPYQALATPFVASTQEDIQNQSKWWFTDPDNWSRAWQAAEDRTPGEAMVDWIISGTNPNISSNKDLDRIRRTNSLYGITSFAADMVTGFKLDPTIFIGKGIGELKAIQTGRLPRSQATGVVNTEALRTARGQGKYKGLDPARRYGAWRGQLILNNFDDLREVTREFKKADNYAGYAYMHMFRGKVTNGQPAALAFWTAADNDELWDLTQRAVLADPDALIQIQKMRDGEVPLIPGGKTFIDAFEAQKTKYSEMDREIKDLERRIAVGDKEDVLFHYYSKELHSTLDRRKADLDQLAGELEQYDDYAKWLDTVPSPENPGMLEQVKAAPGRLDLLSRKTYKNNLFGKTHAIHSITEAGWLKVANPIDLHRADTAVESIRRQAEQFKHFYDYSPDGWLDDSLQQITHAIAGGRHADAAEIAKQVEEVHHINAIHEWSKKFDKREGAPGIHPDALRLFFDQAKFKRNEMTNALLSGDGAVYTTLDGDRAQALGFGNGMIDLEITEGGKRITGRVPEEAIKAHLPQDPTQTAKYYMPLNTREVFLSIKRDFGDNDRDGLWELLDGEVRAVGRKKAAQVFNTIDTLGTGWNRFWKPLQLFRLAWPQRVLMDEGLRGMAVLGMSQWSRNYLAAFGKAAVNSINPYEHPGTFPGVFGGLAATATASMAAPALAPFIVAPALLGGAYAGAKAGRAFFSNRRGLNIGPGPISSEAAGRNYNVAAHEAKVEASPAVPSYYAPQRNAKRSTTLNGILAEAKADRAYRNKRAAIRNEIGDTNFSLLEDEMFPAKPPVAPFYAGIEKAVGGEGWSAGSSAVLDPLNGRPMKSGYAVPVFTHRLSGKRLGDNAADEIEAFVEEHAELLGSAGYRLMVRQDGDALTVSVARHFLGRNVRQAADFSRHVGNDFLVDLNDGGLEYYREWLDEDALGLEAQIAEVEKALDDEPTDMTPEGLETHIQQTMDKMADRPALFRRREFGKGQAKFRAGNGKKVETNAALEGPGEIYATLASGAPTFARLTDTYKRYLSSLRNRAVGYKRLMPPEMDRAALSTRRGREAASEYYTMWADLINNQIRNSPIWFRMLEGMAKGDPPAKTDAEIAYWLENKAEGAKYRRELKRPLHTIDRWVEEHRQALDMYVPREDFQALLRERKLNPSELRQIDQERLPEIYGEELEMIQGKEGLGRWLGDFVEKTYTALGTVPTDTLSRQPFFKANYDLKMRSLIRALDEDRHFVEGPNGNLRLRPELERAYEKLSREFALRQVRKTLYDLGDETNFTQMVRFLSPFWGAQQEALVKWFSIIIERPETLARFYVGIDTVYDNFKIKDEDGNIVKKARPLTDGIFGYEPNDRIMFQVPKSLRKVPPFDKILAGHLGELGTSFGSLNTALQGDMFFMPSLGPIATVPADLMAKHLWDTYGTEYDDEFFYKWLFPVGRPKSKNDIVRVLEQTLPGWGKRRQSLQAGGDDHTWMNTLFLVKREMDANARKKGLPMPTWEEYKRATDWHFALREIGSFVLPASVQFLPENQFYLDEMHSYYDKYGPEAFEKFVQKYGAEAAEYAASSSERLIPATAQGQREWSRVKDLVQEYPEWSSAMMSQSAWDDDFSPDSYNAQFNIELGPGTSQTLATFKDAKQRTIDTNIKTGWVRYRKVDAAINAQLHAAGFTNIQQNGAEKLLALKQQFVTELATKNPDWWQDYIDHEDRVYARVTELQQWAFDPRFDNRPEIQGVRQYLMIRQAAAQSLDAWAASAPGRSRSLQAEENTALRQWFYSHVGQLVLDNPAFAEFYSRYLDTDRLERGTGP